MAPSARSTRRPLPGWVHALFAWLAASALAWVWASLAHGLATQGALRRLGVEIPLGRGLAALMQDLLGLLPSLGLLLAGVLAVAFGVAALVARRAGRLRVLAYPLAGWLGVALALVVMRLVFGFSPLAGARGAGGMLAISLAGLAAGALFALLLAQRRAA